MVALMSVVAVSAAGAPSRLVPVSRRAFPAWMAGPLHGLAKPISQRAFGIVLILLIALYPVAVLGARRLGLRGVLIAVVAAHVILLLAPPLLTGDVFGYIGYARLGVLHGSSPYTHGAVALHHDAVHRFVLWHDVHSPYGPAFTLLSYLTVPLGVAGALWAFKVMAMAAGLACTGLSAAAAGRAGGAPAHAAALVGLNPLLLVYAVGGAHNDLLVAAVAAAALLALGARRGALASGTAILAAAMKTSALLLAPFVILGAPSRRRALAGALAAAALCTGAAVLAFGSSLTGMVGALAQQQRSVSRHSMPSEVASLSGLDIGTVRAMLGAAAATAAAVALVHAWRHRHRAVAAAGWATAALLVSTAWLLPWYIVWLLPLAAVARDRRLQTATFVLTAFMGVTHARLGLG
ncbi:hypothetical protein DSM104329_02524 [Capillimicrobium parvum]|uniref:DUF2029 domain-containing protein n=2 Tax=Capillimicrobium parvum TaxID=2884022 RepID=A0A9E6XXA9_9ACTN|nr:hypothetical protein DSM104329_02524 [Capillimicrobium parvum]